MRVLMIGAGESPPTFIQRQAEALQQIGILVDYLPSITKSNWQSYLEGLGINFRLPSHQAQIVKEADILHYQWPSDWLSLHNIASRYHKKAVLSLRGRQINILPYLPKHEKYTKALHKFLPQCNAFHAVSQSILSEAVKYGVALERSHVIYTSVDIEFFSLKSFISHAFPVRIVMAGGLIWRKGYEFALLALHRIIKQAKSVELVIAGDGPERERIEFTINDLGLAKCVKLTGNLNQIELRDLFQQSHIFLHTSLSEGIANSVVEAMSCGLPVVCTNTGGMCEAIKNGVEGFLIPTRDPEATANSLLKLIDNPYLQKQMGVAGRQRVLNQFTSQKQAQEFMQFYEQILS